MLEKEENRIEFTKEMKKEYTILIPNMANIHFKILKNVFLSHGYKVVLLENEEQSVVNEGLKYVHNDTCYPALLVIGQMIDALNSGKYDINKTALMITQTGGGCRASNYIHLLRKALKRAGYGHVPVISLNLSGLEKNSGFKLTLTMLRKLIATLVYGDILMLLDNQVKPYESNKGDSNKLVESWTEKLTQILKNNKGYRLKELKVNLEKIVDDFSKIPIVKENKVKVGIVGEIYVKYSGLANNNLEKFLREQDCEVMVPGILGFILFKIDNRIEDIKLYGGNKFKYKILNILMNYFFKIEDIMINSVNRSKKFIPPSKYQHTKSLVKDIIGYGNKMGEGWLLTAEMMELIEQGFENIICAQPFGCLPNHISGKGMIRKINSIHKNANIVPIDYDPGATKVNQENRIKLMLSIAKEKYIFSEDKASKDTLIKC